MKQIREVVVRHLFTYALFPPFLMAGLIYGASRWYPLLSGWPRYLALAAFLIIGYFLLKRFTIGLVLVYKAFAPMSVRNACRFTPTCSTYMIMAINKYGLFIGIFKGIGRLLRCKPPYSGEDYP